MGVGTVIGKEGQGDGCKKQNVARGDHGRNSRAVVVAGILAERATPAHATNCRSLQLHPVRSPGEGQPGDVVVPELWCMLGVCGKGGIAMCRLPTVPPAVVAAQPESGVSSDEAVIRGSVSV